VLLATEVSSGVNFKAVLTTTILHLVTGSSYDIHHQFIFHNKIARHNTRRKNNNSERLPEKPQGLMNWLPITVLNITINNAKK